LGAEVFVEEAEPWDEGRRGEGDDRVLRWKREDFFEGGGVEGAPVEEAAGLAAAAEFGGPEATDVYGATWPGKLEGAEVSAVAGQDGDLIAMDGAVVGEGGAQVGGGAEVRGVELVDEREAHARRRI